MHYHANHVDAPARSSKRVALKDARELGLYLDPPIVTAEDIKAHGAEYPLVIRCFRTDCRIVRP